MRIRLVIPLSVLFVLLQCVLLSNALHPDEKRRSEEAIQAPTLSEVTVGGTLVTDDTQSQAEVNPNVDMSQVNEQTVINQEVQPDSGLKTALVTEVREAEVVPVEASPVDASQNRDITEETSQNKANKREAAQNPVNQQDASQEPEDTQAFQRNSLEMNFLESNFLEKNPSVNENEKSDHPGTSGSLSRNNPQNQVEEFVDRFVKQMVFEYNHNDPNVPHLLFSATLGAEMLLLHVYEMRGEYQDLIAHNRDNQKQRKEFEKGLKNTNKIIKSIKEFPQTFDKLFKKAPSSDVKISDKFMKSIKDVVDKYDKDNEKLPPAVTSTTVVHFDSPLKTRLHASSEKLDLFVTELNKALKDQRKPGFFRRGWNYTKGLFTEKKSQ